MCHQQVYRSTKWVRGSQAKKQFVEPKSIRTQEALLKWPRATFRPQISGAIHSEGKSGRGLESLQSTISSPRDNKEKAFIRALGMQVLLSANAKD